MKTVRTLYVNRLHANVLTVRRVRPNHSCERPIRCHRFPFQREICRLERQIQALQIQVAGLEMKLSQVVPNYAAIRRILEAKRAQSVTIVTPGGAVTGIITVIGTDAVEIISADGSTVIIPFSKIVAIE